MLELPKDREELYKLAETTYDENILNILSENPNTIVRRIIAKRNIVPTYIINKTCKRPIKKCILYGSKQ